MPPLRKVTDELSPEAWRVMVDGFERGRSSQDIADAVLEATQEQVSARTVARRAAEWREARDRRGAAREQMDALVAALRGGDSSAAEMVQALAMETLRENPEALMTADPVRLARAGMAGEELRLKQRALALKERAVTVLERRVSLLEERETRARAALNDHDGEAMTAEERVRRIKEIYGLAG